MVGKLLKHEILFYCRILWPVGIALLGVGFCGRILQQFENDSEIFSLLMMLSAMLFVLVTGAAFLLTTVASVVRFYKNLFTSEGYLSLTLPITSAQHIFVKLLAATLSFLATTIVVVLATMIFSAGDAFQEVINVASYLFGIWGKQIGAQLPFYVIEVALLLLLSVVGNYLVCYVCMALGQLVRKYRIVVAIAIYFGYYMIGQFLSSMLSIIPSIMMMDESMQKFVEENAVLLLHLSFGIPLVLTAGFAVICFVVTNTIIRNKLNLE